jgi:asparagine synthase (glutamine-hydrolysing)
MCGIVGIVSDIARNHEPLAAMCLTLGHRGPDGSGVHVEPAVSFGHRRLSILDLSDRGRQPMIYRDRYVITYNGEIYNYRELRAELSGLGHDFHTGTDTEVIMAAYDQWGTDCLARFNGMWAFAILDRAERTLFVARDRFGVKPLHFHWRRGLFAFSSEIKALLVHPSVPRQPDLAYVRNYLAHGPSEDLPETAFAGVSRLANASYIREHVDDLLARRPREHRYWTMTPNTSTEKFEPSLGARLAERYAELLQDAVALRLRADVKVGSALSGGLDSSSIVTFVNDSLRRQGAEEQQETFSCVYRTEGTQDCDESAYIEKLAATLGVKSNLIEPREADIAEQHRRMIYFLDTPPESSLMSSWHTFRRVSMTPVKVTLDGQGADEQLGGYLPHIISYLAWCQDPLREAAALRRFDGAAGFCGLGLAASALRRSGFPQLLPATLRHFKKQVFDGTALNVALAHESLHRLTNLIHYADRTSMAFSIESRMPFLDFRLAEFLASVPAAYKVHAGYTKHLAREAMTGRLPAEIVWRKDKMGWPIPEQHWFRGNLACWVEGEIDGSEFVREFRGKQPARDLLASRAAIKHVVRLLNLAVWHRGFFEQKWTLRDLGLSRNAAA